MAHNPKKVYSPKPTKLKAPRKRKSGMGKKRKRAASPAYEHFAVEVQCKIWRLEQRLRERVKAIEGKSSMFLPKLPKKSLRNPHARTLHLG